MSELVQLRHRDQQVSGRQPLWCQFTDLEHELVVIECGRPDLALVGLLPDGREHLVTGVVVTRVTHPGEDNERGNRVEVALAVAKAL